MYGHILRMALAMGGAAALWAAAAEPEVTGMQVQGGAVRILWSTGLDHYIVEKFDPVGGNALAVGTSSGQVDQAAVVPFDAQDNGFYRLHAGLQAVRLADAPLEQAVRTMVGDNKSGPTNWLYDADVAGITHLAVAMRGVANLDGVAGLSDLTWFDLGGNEVGSLEQLAACADLQVLRADGNRLTNLEGIGGLTGLQVLDASHNELTDVAPLAALPALESLYLDHNQLASLEPLATLLNLHVLDLSNNQITSLQPLLQNAQQGGLGAEDAVYLSGNPLADPGEVAALRGYGVTVYFP